MMKNEVVIGQTLMGGGRIYGLDLLRISLAILIYMFHSQMHFNCSYYFLNNFVKVGGIAMTGFLMLSGFVLYITYSCRDFTKIREIRSFYIKRLIAVLPLYYSIAFIHVVYQMIKGEIIPLDVVVLFPVELFSVQSTYFSLFSYSHNGGTWFISCILICYAIYPYLQFMMTNISDKSRKWILIMIIGLLLYAPLVRKYFNLDTVTIYANPFYRLLEFWVGVILAQFVSSGYKFKMSSVWINPISLFVTIFIMVSSISVIRHYYASNDYMLFNWIAVPCFIVIIFNLASMPFKFIQNSRIVGYLSSISFTFFLCQVLPLWTMSQFVCNGLGSDNNLIKIAVSLTICLVGAVFIHEGIEKPASKYLKLKLIK